MDIENVAVSAVKNAIAYCDRLKAEINSGDKEMMWDGNIFLFSNKLQSKETFIARIPVQLKGKSTEDINKKTISYPVEVSCLKGYLKDNGVVYFVVYISQTKKKEKIYYDCLLPYKIKEVLEAHPHQKTINIKLKSLPDEPKDITDIFFNFNRDRGYQINTNTLINYEVLMEKDLIENYFIEFQSHNKTNVPFDYLFNHDLYLYAKTSLGITFPIRHISSGDCEKITVHEPIRLNNKEYFDSYKYLNTPEEIIIRFGKDIDVSLTDNGDGFGVLTYNGIGSLDDQINGCDFLLQLLKENELVTVDFKMSDIQGDNDSLAFYRDIESKYKYLLDLRNALNQISFTHDLELTKFSNEDYQRSVALINNVLYKKGLKLTSSKDPNPDSCFLRESFAGYNLLLYVVKNDLNDDYIISDFYTNTYSTYVKLSGKEIDISQFLLLHRYDLKTFDNIDYITMCNRIIEYGYNAELIDVYTSLLLKIIEAYDYRKESHILESAINLSDWIHRQDKDDMTGCLNLMQCKKRANTLDETDQNYLQSLLDCDDLTKEQIAALHILLDHNEEAIKCISELEIEDYKTFIEYPIYTLLKLVKQPLTE